MLRGQDTRIIRFDTWSTAIQVSSGEVVCSVWDTYLCKQWSAADALLLRTYCTPGLTDTCIGIAYPTIFATLCYRQAPCLIQTRIGGKPSGNHSRITEKLDRCSSDRSWWRSGLDEYIVNTRWNTVRSTRIEGLENLCGYRCVKRTGSSLTHGYLSAS